MLWPFLSVVAWESGHRIAAPLLGLAVALLLLLITTTTLDGRRDLAAPVGEPAEAAQHPGRRLDRRSRLPLSGDVGGHIERQLRLALGAGGSVLDLLAAAWARHWRADQRRARGTGLWLLGLTMEALVLAAVSFAVLNRLLRLGVVGVAGRESGGRGTISGLSQGR